MLVRGRGEVRCVLTPTATAKGATVCVRQRTESDVNNMYCVLVENLIACSDTQISFRTKARGKYLDMKGCNRKMKTGLNNGWINNL